MERLPASGFGGVDAVVGRHSDDRQPHRLQTPAAQDHPGCYGYDVVRCGTTHQRRGHLLPASPRHANTTPPTSKSSATIRITTVMTHRQERTPARRAGPYPAR